MEAGSHRSLVRRGGIYAGLVAKQSGGGLGSDRGPATVRFPLPLPLLPHRLLGARSTRLCLLIGGHFALYML